MLLDLLAIYRFGVDFVQIFTCLPQFIKPNFSFYYLGGARGVSLVARYTYSLHRKLITSTNANQTSTGFVGIPIKMFHAVLFRQDFCGT